MSNASLHAARRAKNDEFYTPYIHVADQVKAILEARPDVFVGRTVLLPCDDPEWSQFTRFFLDHFESLKLKRLIFTSYTMPRHDSGMAYVSLFDEESPGVAPEWTRGHILDVSSMDGVDPASPPWRLLDGDGDFRSGEVTALRDEADVVITNPPFSLFRGFIDWCMTGGVLFDVMGLTTLIASRRISFYMNERQLWWGAPCSHGIDFRIPATTNDQRPSEKTQCASNVTWWTNMYHTTRVRARRLMTMGENRLNSPHEAIREHGYRRYDNYDAIDVPFVDAIPSDWEGIMGVPFTILHGFDSSQFDFVQVMYNDCGERVRMNDRETFIRVFIRNHEKAS